MQQLPTIAGVEITTDAAGRFNLNALHRASGTNAAKSPSQWLRHAPAQELIEAWKKQNASEHSENENAAVSVVNGGSTPGTFAHELIAVSYAAWVSPEFQLQVNSVFVEYRTGRLAPAVPTDPRIDLLTAAMRAGLITRDEASAATMRVLDSMMMGAATAVSPSPIRIDPPASPKPRKPALVRIKTQNAPVMGHGSNAFVLAEIAQYVVGGEASLLRAMRSHGLITDTDAVTLRGRALVTRKGPYGHHWKVAKLLDVLSR